MLSTAAHVFVDKLLRIVTEHASNHSFSSKFLPIFINYTKQSKVKALNKTHAL